MIDKLIGRLSEREALIRCTDSNDSEFVIVCGRRRIGKTYLIEQHFNKKFDFKFVGGHNMKTRDQLRAFSKALSNFSHQKPINFKDWFDAFNALQDYLQSLPARKKIIFIDEMPWIDSKRSNFISALENFWNGWAMSEENILLIATGSATSWMTDKLIKNKGGLHNRITERIYLKPFTLKETELYLANRNIHWDRYQILQTYMLTGGVPFYLKQLHNKESLAQNIDRLCFSDNGTLRNEFEELYHAVFNNADTYISVVKALGSNKDGLSRKQLTSDTMLNGRNLTQVLSNLEHCGFITSHSYFGKKSKDTIFRLADFYTMFYFKFIEHNKDYDSQWWSHHLNSPGILAWMGLSFEMICLSHHQQIKKALGINGMATSISTWRLRSDKNNSHSKGAQIDLVIERADRMIHLCEIKFSQRPYTITKEYHNALQQRLWLFQENTKTPKTVVQTMITTYGVSNASNWSLIHSNIDMNALFE